MRKPKIVLTPEIIENQVQYDLNYLNKTLLIK